MKVRELLQFIVEYDTESNPMDAEIVIMLKGTAVPLESRSVRMYQMRPEDKHYLSFDIG